MKILTKSFIFGMASIAFLASFEMIAQRTVTVVDTTRNRSPRRRTVVYESRNRGRSTARGVFGGAATGALIGGIAGGGRGAGIGLGVGALTGGLIGSSRDRSRPKYREVVYEYDNDDDIDLLDAEDEDIVVEE